MAGSAVYGPCCLSARLAMASAVVATALLVAASSANATSTPRPGRSKAKRLRGEHDLAAGASALEPLVRLGGPSEREGSLESNA
jgi:hypothetical protein